MKVMRHLAYWELVREEIDAAMGKGGMGDGRQPEIQNL